jgi:ribosomal protein S18 acetylase RimI-like enzyme
MDQKRAYTIRAMSRQELDLALDWAAAEGWNPGLHDADCFYEADPNGFLLGLLGNEPVATISMVRYGAGFGFLGFYIVKPEFRGKGYGIQIWEAGLAHLCGRTIGLDGVIAQQENYRKSGFVLAHRNIRYQGAGGGPAPNDSRIVELSSIPHETLCAYDRQFFPESRSAFLKCWINQPESTALGIRAGGSLAGYGVIRQCRSGHKIGPLFADDPELAERLFLALKASIPGNAPVFLDIPAVNPAAISLAERHQMLPSFETARMYRGEDPRLPLDRLFGVTTFELG